MSVEDIIIKSEIEKINNKHLTCLSSIYEMVGSVNNDRLKELQSFELSNKYWNLLKSSKSSMKDIKDMVDTLLNICNKWNKILILKNEGNILNEDEKDFISNYVEDELKEYFTTLTNVNLINIQDEWYNFNTKAKELTKEQKLKRKTIANDVSIETIIKKYGLLCGFLCMTGGGVVLKLKMSVVDENINHEMKVDSVISVQNSNLFNLNNIALFMIIGGIVGSLAIYFLKTKQLQIKSKQQKSDKKNDNYNDEHLWITHPVTSSFISPSISKQKINQFFSNLIENYDLQLKTLQVNVVNIIGSLEKLQHHLNNAITQINSNQNQYHL